MKKLLIIAILLIVNSPLMSKDSQIGKTTFINTDNVIKLGVDTTVSTKRTDSDLIPFTIFAVCKNSFSAHFDRNSFILVFNGKEYHMPDYKFVKENYTKFLQDKKLFTRSHEHISAAMGAKHIFKAIRFFPDNQYKGLVENVAYVDYKTGMTSVLFFKNPGIKAGDTVTIKVIDSKKQQNISTITFEI